LNIEETLSPEEVRGKVHTVGICGSDAYYYQHGKK
jgi:threonine dehydrogenase-like Zn-dependent dehydrogenase